MTNSEPRIIRHCQGCGRPVPEGETPKEWAAREIEHHGPPPQKLVDLVKRVMRRNGF